MPFLLSHSASFLPRIEKVILANYVRLSDRRRFYTGHRYTIFTKRYIFNLYYIAFHNHIIIIRISNSRVKQTKLDKTKDASNRLISIEANNGGIDSNHHSTDLELGVTAIVIITIYSRFLPYQA